jgi:hypothetical protein
MWTDAGVPFHLANGWIKAGFNPAEGIEWINAGLGQADVANTWKELGLGVSEYLDWRKVTTSPSIVEICILNSIEPQEFIDWKANGFEDISEILRWKSSNLSPNAASFFIRNSVELEVAITWVGLAPGQLSFFNGEASEWVKSNFKHDEAKSWHKIPVPIRIAEEWRKSGLKAEDYLQFDSSTIEFYLTPSQRLAWALGGVSIQDVASWCRIGITDFPNARYLMKSGNTVESLIQENAKAARIAEEKRQRSKEKRLANREKQLKESNRINRENAKAARIAEEKRQRSKEKRLANRSLSGNKPFQVKLSNHHLSKYSTIEWLEEVQAKAELLKGMISKTNQWPIEFYFSDHELLVAVFVEGDVVTGTLMSGEAQISVIFNFSTFAPVQRISTAIQRLAFGLTLSLLIDSTIVLKKSSERSSRLFRLYTKTERVDCAIQTRYLPTESFQAGIQEIRQGHGVPKALHQVVGHIRTFQNGQKPSAEARGNAPIFLKRRLSSNQTYVAPHSRGSIERVAEYNKQLSRFSALAHAIAYLE